MTSASHPVEKWFGSSFQQLHPRIRALHEHGGKLKGQVEIAYGRGMGHLLGKLLAHRLGLPPPSPRNQLEVEYSVTSRGLHWSRCFNGRQRFVSLFQPHGSYPQGQWVEQSGVLDQPDRRKDMSIVIDHLTVVAPSLEAGAAFVEQALGVSPRAGGVHAHMGTHNLLLSLGPAMYLEVIAINPDAPAPPRPRWFGLDAMAPDAPPRLAAWVAGTQDIHAASSRSDQALGQVETMTRDGLSWLMTVLRDGALPMGGALPALIEWPQGVHPCKMLPASGCTLQKLEIHHPDPWLLERSLNALGFASQTILLPAQGAAPALIALIDTPWGRRALGAD